MINEFYYIHEHGIFCTSSGGCSQGLCKSSGVHASLYSAFANPSIHTYIIESGFTRPHLKLSYPCPTDTGYSSPRAVFPHFPAHSTSGDILYIIRASHGTAQSFPVGWLEICRIPRVQCSPQFLPTPRSSGPTIVWLAQAARRASHDAFTRATRLPSSRLN